MSGVWPSTLPQLPDIDWREQADPQWVDFPTDAGFSKRRRRVTRERRVRNIHMDFSGTQIATFRTFFNSTLNGGGDEFTVTSGDPVGGTTVTYRFLSPPRMQQWLGADTTAARRYSVDMVLEVIGVA